MLKFTGLLKDMIKDTDEQPDEEICRARSGSVPSTGAAGPLKSGCISLLVWMCLPAWKPSEACAVGIFVEPASHRHDYH